MDTPENAPGHCPLAKNTDDRQCLLPFIPIYKGSWDYILKLFGGPDEALIFRCVCIGLMTKKRAARRCP